MPTNTPSSSHGHPHLWKQHLLNEQGWEATARINRQLAVVLGILGQHEEAAHVLHDEAVDLEEAQHEGEEALRDLVEEEIEHDLHLRPEHVIAKVHAAQPQLQLVIPMLHSAAQHALPPQDPFRHEVDSLHVQLHEQLTHPIETHHHAVATLEALEAYLRLIQHLAETHEPVRQAWLAQVETIVSILHP